MGIWMSSNGNLAKESKKKRRHRSPSSSRSPSPSREKKSRRAHRSRSREHTYSRSPPPESKRLHIANLDDSVRRRDIEDAFGKFGPLEDVWMASYPPFYAFVVYEKGDDAKEAMREMRSGYVRSCHIRTTVALPRQNRGGPPPRRFDSFRERSRSRDRGGRRSRSRSPKSSRRSRTRSPPSRKARRSPSSSASR